MGWCWRATGRTKPKVVRGITKQYELFFCEHSDRKAPSGNPLRAAHAWFLVGGVKQRTYAGMDCENRVPDIYT